jgi:small conductance mechanosensitive channel
MLAASTLAVGLALQNSMANFAAGVMIILFRHFRVGDSIEAGGVAGTVEEISIFDTHLTTDDNRKIIVPNGKILASHIVNASAKPLRRLDLVFHVSYESNLKQAKAIILSSVNEDIRALPNPPPAVLVTNLGENAVHLTVRVWTAIGDYDNLRSHLLEDVKLRFDTAGIVIPRPQREVHVRTEK